MKTAVVHEWLVNYMGSERVVEQLLHCYPEADLHCLIDFLPPGERGFIRDKPARTSFVQRLPGARRHYQSYLPLMPLAVEQFDLSAYDLVLSSSHAVAKGVLVGPHQLHICYCHSPIRYAWDLQHQYLREAGLTRGPKAWLVRWLLHRLRQWDARTANGVDAFVANSAFVAQRIWRAYRRAATVIHPPVDVDAFPMQADKDDYYLCASRMTPYKRVRLVVEAFSAMPQRRLVVIGDGPEMKRVRAAAGANVTLLGHQPHEVMREHMQRARAFVFAAEEDFGITPVEAQAAGTPVIAFGRGGVLETVQGLDAPTPTGVFFAEQSVPALQAAVEAFEAAAGRISPEACRASAERFGVERFRSEFTGFVDRALERFGEARRTGRPLLLDPA